MTYSIGNTIWVLLGALLVFFMQAGFAMVEVGFTRVKNSGNIIMKNLLDFSIAAPIFWLIGFGLMFGKGNGIIGWFDLFTGYEYSFALPNGVPFFAFFIFQTVFCGTSATIVSGAMAERTKFVAYCIYSIVISLLIYPISGHWIWGGGWLSELGFHDFAGSTAVHLVGGIAGLVGAKMVGPRIGKYTAKGESNAIAGHSLTFGALGVFILWFCWFGFNGCSTLGMDTDEKLILAGIIFVNTNLSAAVSTCTAMLITWKRYGKPDVSMSLNGALAGLVAITAGCDVVKPGSAVIIGILAGITIVFAVELIDNKFKIDDPVGAISVHGVCGALGTILIGFFSTRDGLFYTGSFKFLGIQCLGILAVAIWVSAAMTICFYIVQKTIGLRVAREEEMEGLDMSEHGIQNSFNMPYITEMKENIGRDGVSVPMDAAITVEMKQSEIQEYTASNTKLTKVEIIMKQAKFETLKEAMNGIGVTGMTVTHVMGCGMQKGAYEYYRGVPMEMNLLPKIKVEIVVAKVPILDVINAAKKALYTGHIGDGKIFVYNVENVLKVRTGETGYDAMQGAED